MSWMLCSYLKKSLIFNWIFVFNAFSQISACWIFIPIDIRFLMTSNARLTKCTLKHDAHLTKCALKQEITVLVSIVMIQTTSARIHESLDRSEIVLVGFYWRSVWEDVESNIFFVYVIFHIVVVFIYVAIISLCMCGELPWMSKIINTNVACHLQNMKHFKNCLSTRLSLDCAYKQCTHRQSTHCLCFNCKILLVYMHQRLEHDQNRPVNVMSKV